MTRNQKMAMAEKHVQNIYESFEIKFPNIKLLGVTKEEKEIALKVYALMWLSALEQKPGNYKEADEFVRNIIISSSAMIDMGLINKHAKII